MKQIKLENFVEELLSLGAEDNYDVLWINRNTISFEELKKSMIKDEIKGYYYALWQYEEDNIPKAVITRQSISYEFGIGLIIKNDQDVVLLSACESADLDGTYIQYVESILIDKKKLQKEIGDEIDDVYEKGNETPPYCEFYTEVYHNNTEKFIFPDNENMIKVCIQERLMNKIKAILMEYFENFYRTEPKLDMGSDDKYWTIIVILNHTLHTLLDLEEIDSNIGE